MKEITQVKISKSNSKQSITAPTRTHTHYKKYNKITEVVRTSFLELIINENYSIKKAAERLNINYSSAKSIIADFRKESQRSFKKKQPTGAKVCDFAEVEPHTLGKITLFGSIGNNITSQKEIFSIKPRFTLIPIYHYYPQTIELFE